MNEEEQYEYQKFYEEFNAYKDEMEDLWNHPESLSDEQPESIL